MTPSAARLLTQIDPLSWPERSATVSRIAREGAGTPELDVLLRDLSARGSWERGLSLRLASIAGHAAHVRECLTWGSTSLTIHAIGPAVRLGLDADTLLELLHTMPAAVRGALRTALRTADPDLADALLEPVRRRFGDHEAAALLPACSDEVVGRELGSLAYAVASWTTLARRHPTEFLAHVEGELAAAPRSTWREALGRLAPGLAVLAPEHPDRVLSLLERTVAHVDLPGPFRRVLASLARHDPARVLELFLDPRRPGPVPLGKSLLRALLALDDAALVRLARALDGAGLARLLRVLPPSRRPAVYLPIVGERDLVRAGISLDILDLLPDETRYAEAARLLSLHGPSADQWFRLQLIARRPWSEAEPVLRETADQPRAEERAQAYPLLVLAAWSTRDPETVESLLASLGRLRNEQDPVRLSAFTALAASSVALLTDAAADALVDQANAAVQARDVSSATTQAVRRLGYRLIGHGAEQGRERMRAAGLRALGDAAGHLDLVVLARQAGSLPRSTDPLVRDALLPRMTADERVGDYAVVFALARSLGRRAWVLGDVQERLGRACRASDDADVRTAIGLWLAAPATRDERVGILMAHDPSTIAIPAVATAVASRRTDLLDVVLDGRPRGRFATKGVRLVPSSMGAYAERWMPRQIDRYRMILLQIVDRMREQRVWESAATVGRLGRLPLGSVVVRHYLDDPSPQLAAAALSALAWVDMPALALTDLLARSGGDRAHVAFSALTRVARFVPPDDLGRALTGVLGTGKITARKEVCRLIAEHHVPGAAAVLAGELTRPDQHRDVRRAVVSALRHLLDDESSWTALGQAAADAPVATALLDVGAVQIAPRHRASYAGLVLTVAGSADRETSTEALRALVSWMRWEPTDGAAALAADRLCDLADASPVRWVEGASVLASAALAGRPDPLLAAADRLLVAHDERDLTDGFDAGVRRDLPARQRLDGLGRELARALLRDPVAVRPVALLVAERMATRDLLADLAVRLAGVALPWERPDDVVPALLHVVGMCQEGTELGAVAGRAARDGLRTAADRQPADVSLGWVRGVLAAAEPAAPDPAAAVVGLVLLAALGEHSGWSEPLREELRALRRHPDAEVRRAAARTVTAYE